MFQNGKAPICPKCKKADDVRFVGVDEKGMLITKCYCESKQKKGQKIKEVEKAIEWFRLEHVHQESNYDSHPFKDKKDEDYIKVLETVLDCLQSELDRQENKALTLSELKEMVGEPVWVAWENGTFCHIVDEFDYKKDMLIFTEDFASITLIKKGVTKIYKHKPTEGVGR